MSLSHHKSPLDGDEGGVSEITTDVPAPTPVPPAMLISTVVPLTANVFPAPIKFNCVIPTPIGNPPD